MNPRLYHCWNIQNNCVQESLSIPNLMTFALTMQSLSRQFSKIILYSWGSSYIFTNAQNEYNTHTKSVVKLTVPKQEIIKRINYEKLVESIHTVGYLSTLVCAIVFINILYQTLSQPRQSKSRCTKVNLARQGSSQTSLNCYFTCFL